MPIEVKELVILAKRLQEGKDEVSLRASVSRAYYYLYHLLRTYVENSLEDFVYLENLGTHESLIRSLSEYSRSNKPKARNAALLSSLMRQARQKRVKADYHISEDFNEDETRIMLTTTIQIDNIISK